MPKNTCPICTNTMKRHLTTTSCKHTFHNRCIRKWHGTKTFTQNNVSCPMCRTDLKRELKTEFTTREKDLLVRLDELHEETHRLFDYLMESRAKTAKAFLRTGSTTERLERGISIWRKKQVGGNKIPSSLYDTVFHDVVSYVFLMSDPREYTPNLTRYVALVYDVLKQMLLFYKKVYETYPKTAKIVLLVKHAGEKQDIMENEFIQYLRNLVGEMYEEYTRNPGRVPANLGKQTGVKPRFIVRKPKRLKKVIRLYELCCVSQT